MKVAMPNAVVLLAKYVALRSPGARSITYVDSLLIHAAIESKWVRREVDLAIADPKMVDRIIPILIDNTKPGDLSKFLDVMQYLDAREEPRIVEVLRDRILSETSGDSASRSL